VAQIVFWVLVGAWLALEVFLHVAYNPRIRQTNGEKLSKYVMLAAFLVGILSGRIFFPDFAVRFREPFTALRIAGMVLLAASIALRIVSVVQLGKAYSVNLGVRPAQPLVTSGLYRVVRHPGYFSLALGFLGIALSFSQLVPSIICVAVPVAALLYRIRVEEGILENAYGEQYRAYKVRTRMIVPWIL
jgi:protein-S-isoprenylcysteine O-methyltransferase Ste14